MTSQSNYRALVFGASGITGHAILKELLQYPDPKTFSRVVGLTNRPLSKENASLPDDDRIELISGLDLTDREKTFQLLKNVAGIDKITHVFYTAYAGHGSNYQKLKDVNTKILKNAVDACDECCPDMKYFTLQTGGKAYGVEFVGEGCPYNPPLSESLPRVPEPWASNIFYYAQYDIMREASANKSWQFCEIRPDAIVGFVPNNNAMNIAQGVGIFLALYRHIHGEGTKVPFPGDAAAWQALHTDTSQDILAKFHVHASLNPNETHERAFNVVDGPATTWKEVWPELCAYFGLTSQAPSNSGEPFDVAQWMDDHSSQWRELVAQQNLKEDALKGTGFGFVQAVMGIPFRRDYDPSASRSVGFSEERPHAEGYKLAFEEMKKAKIIS